VQAPLPPDEEERLKALHRHEILGYALGLPCVSDQLPRDLNADQNTALQMLSRQAAGHGLKSLWAAARHFTLRSPIQKKDV
jgi:hypothetical protein